LQLPFADPGPLGNEVGVRVWKGNFLETPAYLAPFDQVVMASCFGSEWDAGKVKATCPAAVIEGEDGGEDAVDFEVFLDAWLSKCSDLLRPGGLVVFQELELGDNSKAEKTFARIREAAAAKHPLANISQAQESSSSSSSSSSFLCLKLPEAYAFGGSPLRLKSRVVHGFKRGSKQLGFPTANLHVPTIEDQIRSLKKGVYFGWAKVNFKDKRLGESFGKHPRKVVVNVGERPSFEDGTNVTIEVHIMDYAEAEDFYGEEMRVILLGFIRPEMKFAGIGDLVGRIRRDIGIAGKQLEDPEWKSAQVDAFVNGRNVAYSFKAFETNAKWTTTKKVMGWTLFRIVSHRKKRGAGGSEEKQVELMAVCDKQKRIWLDKTALKKDLNWQPGWFDPPS